MRKVVQFSVAATIVVYVTVVGGYAFAGPSANLTATSNYIWRGVTQTDDQAAVQGGLDYETDIGLYAGTWMSNVNFDGTRGFELDLYGGYGGEFQGFNYDVGLIYYVYPSMTKVEAPNFLEIYLTGGYGPLSTGVYVTLDKQETDKDNDFYIPARLDFDVDVFSGIGIGLFGGYYKFDDPDTEDYGHWGADLSKGTDYGDFKFAVEQNNLSGETADDPRVWVSWSMSLDL